MGGARESLFYHGGAAGRLEKFKFKWPKIISKTKNWSQNVKIASANVNFVVQNVILFKFFPLFLKKY